MASQEVRPPEALYFYQPFTCLSLASGLHQFSYNIAHSDAEHHDIPKNITLAHYISIMLIGSDE